MRGKYSCHGLPAKDVPVKHADAGCPSPAEINGDLDEFMEHVSRAFCHFSGKGAEGAVFLFVVRCRARTTLEFAPNIDFLEGDGLFTNGI
jgi:hypothetical protein